MSRGKKYKLKKIFTNKWFIIFWLVVFAPIGVFLMWKYTNWTAKTKYFSAITASVFFLVFIISGYNAPPSLQVSALGTNNIIQSKEEKYTLRGNISTLHNPKLTINDQPVAYDSYGDFAHVVNLKFGDNIFKIVAVSEKGNSTQIITIQRGNADVVPGVNTTNNSELYDVIGITDGDTIKVRRNGITETVRLIGIDTPETKDPNKPVQCYGKDASSRMQHYVQSKKVRLEADASQDNKDKYQRILRYVFLENGTHVGLKMIQEGFAKEYTYSKPYKYQPQFKQAESDARNNKLGLWAPTTCNGTVSSTVNTASPSPQVTKSTSVPVSTPKPNSVPPTSSGGTGGIYFANCTAAKNAGAAPLYAGQPGYRSALDRDSDGVACES